jgi:hypothetical protein
VQSSTKLWSITLQLTVPYLFAKCLICQIPSIHRMQCFYQVALPLQNQREIWQIGCSSGD